MVVWERILRASGSGRSVFESHMIMNHDDPLGTLQDRHSVRLIEVKLQ